MLPPREIRRRLPRVKENEDRRTLAVYNCRLSHDLAIPQHGVLFRRSRGRDDVIDMVWMIRLSQFTCSCILETALIYGNRVVWGHIETSWESNCHLPMTVECCTALFRKITPWCARHAYSQRKGERWIISVVDGMTLGALHWHRYPKRFASHGGT